MNYLTTRDVAEALVVHEQTVRHLIQAGELRALRVGQRYRIHPDEVKRFVEARLVVPASEEEGW